MPAAGRSIEELSPEEQAQLDARGYTKSGR